MPDDKTNSNLPNLPEEEVVEAPQFGEPVDNGYQQEDRAREVGRERKRPRPKSKQEEKREELREEAKHRIKEEVRRGVGDAANKAIVEPAKALAQKATQAVVTAARQAVAAAAKWIATQAAAFAASAIGSILVAAAPWILAILAVILILLGVISFFYPAQIPSPTGKTIASFVDPLNPSSWSYQDEAMGRYGFPVAADTELAYQIATIANGQVGNAETSKDCGPSINQYFPGRCGQPWCAYFATWVINQAGGKIPRYGSARDVENFYKKAGRWSSTPAVGDAYTVPRLGGSGRHVGLVVAVNGSTVTVTDGNWDKKVSRYNRSASSAVGFGVPYK